MKHLRLLFTRSYQGNIPKIYVYGFIANFFLILPIWVIFLQQRRGLSLTQVTFTDVAFWFTIVLAEVPTGVVADLFGRVRSVAISVVLGAFSMVMFALAPTFPLLMLANSLWAVAVTFHSGAAQALFYDSLVQLDRAHDYTRLRGRLAVVELGSASLASVVGGLLGALDLQLPFLINAAIMAASLIFVLRMQEPPAEPDPETLERLTLRRALSITARAVRQEPQLRYLLLYSNLVPISTTVVIILFIQPYALSIGVPIAAIGLLIGSFTAVSALGAASADRLVRRLGEWNWLRIAPLLIFAGMLFLGLIDSAAGIVLFALAGFAEPAIRPLVESLILRQAPSSVRATILSVDSMIFRLFLVLVEPGLGLLADRRGLPLTFLVLGGFAFLATALVILFWSRLRGRQPPTETAA